MRTIIEISRSFLIACSFLTILPFPRVDWPEDGTKFLSLVLWVVGAVVGSIWVVLAVALSWLNVGAMMRGVIMTLVMLALTGGIHMDGAMDTSDAIFSRRDRETRLKILTDSHVGAFAVMSCVIILLLQSATFTNAFESGVFTSARGTLIALFTIPMWSRLGMGLLLNTLPFAKSGMTQTLTGEDQKKSKSGKHNSHSNPKHTVILVAIALLLSVVNLLTSASMTGGVILPSTWLVLLISWRHCCLNVFGGIAGDLLGAFNELSETVLLVTLVAFCSY